MGDVNWAVNWAVNDAIWTVDAALNVDNARLWIALSQRLYNSAGQAMDQVVELHEDTPFSWDTWGIEC